MEVLCPKCNKGNCRNISAERLYYPSKEDVQKGVSRYDNEIYMTFMCDDCNEEFQRTMEISYVGVEEDALKAKEFKTLKINGDEKEKFDLGEVFNVPEERGRELVEQANQIMEIFVERGFKNINTGDVFNSILMLSKSQEENNMLSYIAGMTLGKLEMVQKRNPFDDLLSRLGR
jgi:hypothetical protein